MKMDFTNNAGAGVMQIAGRLDTATAPQLEEFFTSNLPQITSLTLDCAKLEYVSSAGLRVLLSMQKKLQDALKLTNVCEIVMEVFEMTGFADILTIV